jgi:hypothetical protein
MRMRSRARWALLVSLTAGLLVALAGPALAQSGNKGTLVVLRGSVDVPADETVTSVVIFDGPATIDGTVTGSVVAFHGPITISGSVRGSVIAISDRVVLQDGAQVDGDVKSQKAAVVSPGAHVDGSIGTVDFSNWDDVAHVSRYIWWFAVTISSLALGACLLLLPSGARTRIDAAASRVGPAIGWGAVAFFGLPIAAIILLVIVITLPLGLALLFALGFLAMVAYVVTAWVLGGRIARNAAPFLAFLAGWGILRAVALLPILGGTVWTLAVIFGAGVLALAIWSRSPAAPTAAAVAPAAPAPPIPPPPAPTTPTV